MYSSNICDISDERMEGHPLLGCPFCAQTERAKFYMEMVKGKYADAKVFAEDLEQYARVQLQMICDDPVAEGSVIRVMPDVHPGKVGTVGLTMTIGSRVIPNLLGVDIGCGMSCMQIKEKKAGVSETG